MIGELPAVLSTCTAANFFNHFLLCRVSKFSPKLLIEESQDTSHEPSPSAVATPTSKVRIMLML